MTCVLCEQDATGRPGVVTDGRGWRGVIADGERYYACANCQPPIIDGQEPSSKAWEEFYIKFIGWIVLHKRNGRAIQHQVTILRERD